MDTGACSGSTWDPEREWSEKEPYKNYNDNVAPLSPPDTFFSFYLFGFYSGSVFETRMSVSFLGIAAVVLKLCCKVVSVVLIWSLVDVDC